MNFHAQQGSSHGSYTPSLRTGQNLQTACRATFTQEVITSPSIKMALARSLGTPSSIAATLRTLPKALPFLRSWMRRTRLSVSGYPNDLAQGICLLEKGGILLTCTASDCTEPAGRSRATITCPLHSAARFHGMQIRGAMATGSLGYRWMLIGRCRGSPGYGIAIMSSARSPSHSVLPCFLH